MQRHKVLKVTKLSCVGLMLNKTENQFSLRPREKQHLKIHEKILKFRDFLAFLLQLSNQIDHCCDVTHSWLIKSPLEKNKIPLWTNKITIWINRIPFGTNKVTKLRPLLRAKLGSYPFLQFYASLNTFSISIDQSEAFNKVTCH